MVGVVEIEPMPVVDKKRCFWKLAPAAGRPLSGNPIFQDLRIFLPGFAESIFRVARRFELHVKHVERALVPVMSRLFSTRFQREIPVARYVLVRTASRLFDMLTESPRP